MSIIEVSGISKEYKISDHKGGLIGYINHIFNPKYKKFTAVNNISFKINQGEIVGYLGENGAGKSTTIKMLSGLLTPTNGIIKVNGIVPYKNRIQNNFQIGAVFGQKTQLWWDLPVFESFKLIGNLYKMTQKDYEKNLNWIVEKLELKELLNKQVKNLSLGQKMKCEIAATFLHKPKVVYLDEPTIGLDVLVKENIRNFIKEYNKEFNTTIILTTHDVKDVEELCDRIILIDKGKIIYDGNINSFRSKYSNNDFLTIFKKETISFINKIKLDGIEVVEESKNYIKIKFNQDKISIIEIIEKFKKYYTILNVETNEAKMEEILKEIYRGNIDVD